MVDEEPAQCPFCKRPTLVLKVHHLIPKEHGGTDTTASCRACHDAIHTVFTNKELRDHFHTVSRLMAHAQFRRMIRYIAKQDPGSKVAFARTRSRKRKR